MKNLRDIWAALIWADGAKSGLQLAFPVGLRRLASACVAFWLLGPTVLLAAGAQFYVAPTGDDNSATGSAGAPFKTISRAIRQASYGDAVSVLSGTYRESLFFHPTGQGQPSQVLPNLEAAPGSWGQMLTIQSAPGAEVFLKGSDVVGGWQIVTSPVPGMTLWRASWSVRSQQVFVDGRLLGHVGWNSRTNNYPTTNEATNLGDLAQVKNGAGVSVLQQNTAHMTNWSFFHDFTASHLYVGVPAGVNLSTALVEASVRMPVHMTYDFIRLKGIKIRHSNLMFDTGGWPAVALRNYGMIDSCDIQWCDFEGIFVRNQCIITNSVIANNGMIGLTVVGTNTVVTGCQISTNFYLPFDFRGEAAGSKNIGVPEHLDGCRFEGNEFAFNRAQGLWFDTMGNRNPTVTPVVVQGNLFHGNSGSALMIENAGGVRVANNLFVRNPGTSVLLSSATNSWVLNNTILAPTNSYLAMEVSWRSAANLILNTCYYDYPHHLWISNNIIGSEDVYAGGTGNDPRILMINEFGNCVGATNIFFDYNLYLHRSAGGVGYSFSLHNLDLYRTLAATPPCQANLNGPGCSSAQPSCVRWLKSGASGACPAPPDAWGFLVDWAGWTGFGYDQHSVFISDAPTIDAFFANASLGDYRISSLSPAARAGVNLWPFLQRDYLGRSRPPTGGPGFSIGAFEFTDTVRIVATDPAAAETGGNPGSFAIERDAVDLSLPLAVDYTTGGTATAGTDYSALTGTAAIQGGRSNAPVNVSPIGDLIAEPSETVTATLSPGANYFVSGIQNSATVTIDDGQVVSIVASDSTASEPGVDTGRFTVSRQGPTGSPLAVNYSVSGTAASGVDYCGLGGSVIIAAGQASATITVTPFTDTFSESTETVIVTVSPSSTYLLGPTTATVNILNAPVVGVSAGGNAGEPSTAGGFTISRGSTAATPLTVSYTVSGTASGGSDYVALSGTATIPANASSVAVPVTPVDDGSYEGTETVTLSLPPNPAYNLYYNTATISLTDNEQLVSIAATDPTAAEPGADTGTFTILRQGPTAASLTVSYLVGGTAAGGVDYYGLGGLAVIPAGQASATITITPFSDTSSEATETVVVTLMSSAAYLVGAQSSATVNILNAPVVAISAGANAAEPSTAGGFTISRDSTAATPLTVNYTVGGTAVGGSDYVALNGTATIPANASSVTVPVTPVDDLIYEGSETVTLSLPPNSGYNLYYNTATISLTDNEQLVSIVATDPTAAEPGADTGTFTVSRQGPTLAPLTVSYSVGGTASPGFDYVSLGGVVTFAAGQSSTTVTITPLTDITSEVAETVVVSLSSTGSYIVGTPAAATVNLLNAPVVAVSSGSAASEPATPGTFIINRDSAPATPLTVAYTVSGTATAGSDYVALSGTATIPANANSVVVTMSPIDDLTYESIETVTLNLTASSGYNLYYNAATIYLTDNEQLVSIAGADTTATEPGDVAVFVVNRQGPTNAALTVSYALSGTATPGLDYAAVSGTVVIPAGQYSASITISPLADATAEPTETVVVTLTTSTGYLIGAPASATATLFDLPVMSVNAGSNAVEGGAAGSFVISRSVATPNALTVCYTIAGTATAGSDYVTLSGTVVIPAAATSTMVTVSAINDLLVEGTETVSIFLSGNPNYNINGGAYGTVISILDND